MVEYHLLELIDFNEWFYSSGLYNINRDINKITNDNTTYLSLLPKELIDIIISNIPITMNIGDIIKTDNNKYFKVIYKLVNIDGKYGYEYRLEYKYKSLILHRYIISTNGLIERYGGTHFIDSMGNKKYVFPFVCFYDKNSRYNVSEKNIYHTIDNGYCNIV